MNVEERFHELAVKEALGQATAADRAKLERYQSLRRLKRTAEEILIQETSNYKTRQLIRLLKKLTHPKHKSGTKEQQTSTESTEQRRESLT